MNSQNRTLTSTQLIASTLIAFAIAPGAQAATLSSTTTAPTPGGADIYNLVTPATTNDILNGDRPAAGQTFVTLGNTTGYTLSALTTYQTRNVSTTGGTWNLRLGTVSGTTFTPVYTDSVTVGGSALALSGSGGDYITFTLTTPYELNPNTLYGIDLVRTGAGNYVTWGENDNTNYSGGQSYTSPPVGTGGPTISLANNDRIFLLNMTTNPLPPAPEPSTFALVALFLIPLGRRCKQGKAR